MSKEDAPHTPRKEPQEISQAISSLGPLEAIKRALAAMEPDLIAALADDDPLKNAYQIAKTERVLTDGIPEILEKRERERNRQAESMAFNSVLTTQNSDKLNLHLIASYLIKNHPELLPSLTQVMLTKEGNFFVNQDYENDAEYQERERLNRNGRKLFISNNPPPGVDPT